MQPQGFKRLGYMVFNGFFWNIHAGRNFADGEMIETAKLEHMPGFLRQHGYGFFYCLRKFMKIDGKLGAIAGCCICVYYVLQVFFMNQGWFNVIDNAVFNSGLQITV